MGALLDPKMQRSSLLADYQKLDDAEVDLHDVFCLAVLERLFQDFHASDAKQGFQEELEVAGSPWTATMERKELMLAKLHDDEDEEMENFEADAFVESL